jgi:hypothetical protein
VTIQKWTGAIGALENLVEIKARGKFNRTHMVNIPRIKFFAQRRYRANWPFLDGHWARANVTTSTDATFAPCSTRAQALTVAPVVNTSSTSKIRRPRTAHGSVS